MSRSEGSLLARDTVLTGASSRCLVAGVHTASSNLSTRSSEFCERRSRDVVPLARDDREEALILSSDEWGVEKSRSIDEDEEGVL